MGGHEFVQICTPRSACGDKCSSLSWNYFSHTGLWRPGKAKELGETSYLKVGKYFPPVLDRGGSSACFQTSEANG